MSGNSADDELKSDEDGEVELKNKSAHFDKQGLINRLGGSKSELYFFKLVFDRKPIHVITNYCEELIFSIQYSLNKLFPKILARHRKN